MQGGQAEAQATRPKACTLLAHAEPCLIAYWLQARGPSRPLAASRTPSMVQSSLETYTRRLNQDIAVSFPVHSPGSADGSDTLDC